MVASPEAELFPTARPILGAPLGGRAGTLRARARDLAVATRIILRAEDRKPLPRILYELLASTAQSRTVPTSYVRNMLYYQDQDYRYFLSVREADRLERLIYDKERAPFLKNKLLFYHHLHELGIRLPELLGYNIGPRFFSQRGSCTIGSVDEFRDLLGPLVAASATASVFMKPVAGSLGKSSRKLDAALVAGPELAAVYEAVRARCFVFQETITQHPLLDAVYPHSVNTLRINTALDARARVHVLGAIARFGSGGSQVDNASAGGIAVRIVVERGVLERYAWRYVNYGGARYERHPDTGIPFDGLSIPYFTEALETVRSAAALLPYRLIGWDVAITPDGPVLVEGNNQPDTRTIDLDVGGCKRHPAFASFLRELGVI